MTVLTSSSTVSANETTLQKEQKLFSEYFVRLRDAFLNRLFDLRPQKAIRRLQYLIFLFFLTGFLLSLRFYPLRLWGEYLQDIFYYLFNPTYAANYIGNPFRSFFLFAYTAVTDARTLQYLPIVLAPFFIALQSAAIYLADIFELEEIRVARAFIWEVALSGSDETIRVMQGEISEEHRTSPNYLIGGPGKVIVDLDSVALFEKPDGTPHIIGPTGKEPGGKATLDGFERFRQAIDLRDHYIELRDQDPKSSAVKSRSLDGIPITATDVRFMFSVYREGQKPDDNHPYPFGKKAIEQLIYRATSRVTPDATNPSTFEFSWVNNMISLIRGRLGGFMNEHNLTAYLASIGMPEFEKAKQQEEKIVEQIQQLATSKTEDQPKGREIKPPPEFFARYKIKNLFAQFAEEFTKDSKDRGVELHWIGVGTWRTPIEIVPEKHLEAWKISRENIGKGSDKAMEDAKNEATIQEWMSLIQDVPIAAYQNAMENQIGHKNTIQAVILAFRQQLIEAAEFLRANNKIVSPDIVQAIAYIDSMFGYHWAGRP
ncbi:MAG: hypothetical protein C3F07_07045 [Anaerolineales bacterium]|nr:hypothetical protein [Anaerolineae bacterium]PWB74815.1 MAG: hypothetical protein C3F07_07045 [Anaerolineales bacterium]